MENREYAQEFKWTEFSSVFLSFAEALTTKSIQESTRVWCFKTIIIDGCLV